MVLAFQISVEEERARQEAGTEKFTEEFSKTGSIGQTSTLNDHTVHNAFCSSGIENGHWQIQNGHSMPKEDGVERIVI